MLGSATDTSTVQNCLALAPIQQLPARHQPLMAQKDLGGHRAPAGLAPRSMSPLLDSACRWGCRGWGPASLLAAPSPHRPDNSPLLSFQFSHAAEARAPQDSKETVRGCLPI